MCGPGMHSGCVSLPPRLSALGQQRGSGLAGRGYLVNKSDCSVVGTMVLRPLVILWPLVVICLGGLPPSTVICGQFCSFVLQSFWRFFLDF